MVVKDGVEFDALDGAPVNLLFLIAAPNTEDNVHLEVLSKLSVLLMDENFTNGLKNAKTVDEFLKVIDDAESAKDEDEKEDETGAKYKVLAVTGCPTGIAHTYMAAESLEKHAAEMGITIKVETRGSGGAKHVLTDEEIAGRPQSSLQPTPKFRWTASMERKSSSARSQTASTRQSSC